MTNDAKLGMVVGVGLVIVVAVVFFRKEIAPPRPGVEGNLTANAATTPRNPHRAVKARTTTRTLGPAAGIHHIVKDGETLFRLAQHYYGDGDKYVEIYRVNRSVLLSPEHLTAGTVLFIPDLAQPPEDSHLVRKVKR